MITFIKLLIFTLALLLPTSEVSIVPDKEFDKSSPHNKSSSYAASTKYKFLYLIRVSQPSSSGSYNPRENAGSFLKATFSFAFLQRAFNKVVLLGISYVILGISGVDIIFPFQYFW